MLKVSEWLASWVHTKVFGYFLPLEDKRKQQISKRFCLPVNKKAKKIKAAEFKLCVLSTYKYGNITPEGSVLSKSNLVCMLIYLQNTTYVLKQKSMVGRYRLY